MQTYENDATTEASVVADLAKKSTAPSTFMVGGNTIYFNPQSGTFDALEKYRSTPLRAIGIQTVADADSFLKLVNYYDKQDRFTRFSKSKLSSVCILNAATADTPEAFEDHRINWQLAYDKNLQAWLGSANEWIPQGKFLAFLEERVDDITQNGTIGPTQADMTNLASDLEITTDSTFKSSLNLSNGDYQLSNTSTSRPNLTVPKDFFIGLPMFDGLDKAYMFPMRFRIRTNDGKLVFRFEFHRFDEILNKAWEDVTEQIKAGLPSEVPWINVP